MSRPPARHQKPPRQSLARLDQYDGPYNEAPYRGYPYDGRYDDSPYAETRYHDGRYGGQYDGGLHTEAWYHDDRRYAQARYHDDRRYAQPLCDDRRYAGTLYDDRRYAEPKYGNGPYPERQSDNGRYDQLKYDELEYDDRPYAEPQYDDRYAQPQYDDRPYAEPQYDDRYTQPRYDDQPYYDDARYERGASDRRRPPRDRGAHRHARPPRKRRKPVKIAAAMAGSTLLVAGAGAVTAHWWHRPATRPTALDQENRASTPGAALGAQGSSRPAAAQNTLDQWALIPVGKHAAAQAGGASQTAKRAPAPRPHAPRPKPKATPPPVYQNPLRAVGDLVLERVDMGVDFGGAGPVFALGDGVITNATGDSAGWPGGGYITYQLTDGPDAGLVVYLAEDVTPTVEVGQKVTSSTVIANMFNGGDGIETGWATSDSSTAESQAAAAGGISGGGPFPTMVGLSFDAVLESVGVPAAPNANDPGNGLLPAGYPSP